MQSEELMNIFSNIPFLLPNELIETLVASDHVRIERIVSHGHASPDGFWYDQDQSEFVLLVSGAARLEFESGELLVMKPGDFISIPAHQKHRVGWTTPEEPTIWLAMYYDE